MESHDHLQQRVQTMRQQLGSDWLYTLAVQTEAANQKRALSKPTNESSALEKLANQSPGSFKSVEADDASSFKSLEDIPATEDDIYLNAEEEEEKLCKEDLLTKACNYMYAQDQTEIREERPGSTDSEKQERAREKERSRPQSGPPYMGIAQFLQRKQRLIMVRICRKFNCYSTVVETSSKYIIKYDRKFMIYVSQWIAFGCFYQKAFKFLESIKVTRKYEAVRSNILFFTKGLDVM